MTSVATGAVLGDCVANAPRIFQLRTDKLASKFPITSEADFCGQHLPRALVEADNG
jgi:hypothetical protein